MKIHTSCSKPLWAPYGVILKDGGGKKEIINLKEQGPPSGNYIEFKDGVNAKYNDLFTSCPKGE